MQDTGNISEQSDSISFAQGEGGTEENEGIQLGLKLAPSQMEQFQLFCQFLKFKDQQQLATNPSSKKKSNELRNPLEDHQSNPTTHNNNNNLHSKLNSHQQHPSNNIPSNVSLLDVETDQNESAFHHHQLDQQSPNNNHHIPGVSLNENTVHTTGTPLESPLLGSSTPSQNTLFSDSPSLNNNNNHNNNNNNKLKRQQSQDLLDLPNSPQSSPIQMGMNKVLPPKPNYIRKCIEPHEYTGDPHANICNPSVLEFTWNDVMELFGRCAQKQKNVDEKTGEYTNTFDLATMARSNQVPIPARNKGLHKKTLMYCAREFVRNGLLVWLPEVGKDVYGLPPGTVVYSLGWKKEDSGDGAGRPGSPPVRTRKKLRTDSMSSIPLLNNSSGDEQKLSEELGGQSQNESLLGNVSLSFQPSENDSAAHNNNNLPATQTENRPIIEFEVLQRCIKDSIVMWEIKTYGEPDAPPQLMSLPAIINHRWSRELLRSVTQFEQEYVNKAEMKKRERRRTKGIQQLPLARLNSNNNGTEQDTGTTSDTSLLIYEPSVLSNPPHLPNSGQSEGTSNLVPAKSSSEGTLGLLPVLSTLHGSDNDNRTISPSGSLSNPNSERELEEDGGMHNPNPSYPYYELG